MDYIVNEWEYYRLVFNQCKHTYIGLNKRILNTFQYLNLTKANRENVNAIKGEINRRIF